MRVLAALSGGVDSAVAAARAVDSGHDVTAVHLALARDPAAERDGARGCCSLEDARDARRVADVLGVPFYVWDLADRFESDVIDDFVAEYEAGRTPNPCLRCNERIKFSAMLDRAVALDFDAVATGHYASVRMGAHGVELHRAVDPAKDQSYVLGVLESWQLERALFPLGDDTKDDVRGEAARRGLLVADKRDSHDICFISDGRTAAFLEERLGPRPGDIVDAETGETIGTHDGAYGFTVGQRKGLHIGQPRSDGAPRYVLEVDAASRTVLVGPESLLATRAIEGGNAHWAGPIPECGARLGVQVRAHGRETPCTVNVEGDVVRIELESPERGVAPGQAAVLYEGTRVVGSVTITSASSRATVRG